MKTRTLSTRIDDDIFDWIYKKSKASNMSRVVCEVLRQAKESEERKKK